jgi:hypothetical protein
MEVQWIWWTSSTMGSRKQERSRERRGVETSSQLRHGAYELLQTNSWDLECTSSPYTISLMWIPQYIFEIYIITYAFGLYDEHEDELTYKRSLSTHLKVQASHLIQEAIITSISS